MEQVYVFVTVIDAGIPCGKIIGTTVIENEEFLKELLDISPTVCFDFFVSHGFLLVYHLNFY